MKDLTGLAVLVGSVALVNGVAWVGLRIARSRSRLRLKRLLEAGARAHREGATAEEREIYDESVRLALKRYRARA